VKLPVVDLAEARDWYGRVFGFRTTMEFPDADGVVRGVVGTVPGLGDTLLALRENATAAAGCTDFDPISFGVKDHEGIVAWAARLDDLAIPHSPVIEASEGWLLVFAGPGGVQLHLYTWAHHGIDHSARPGYGRAITESSGKR
jgi:catechol 2,3-dioxygenase-like lactoylglutathione lyase family enzyme